MNGTGRAELSALRERVDAWRQTRGKRRRIPDELWNAAVEVAKVEGIWATAHATRLNYQRLREQFDRAKGREPARQETHSVATAADEEAGSQAIHAALARMDGKPGTGTPRRNCEAEVRGAFVELAMGNVGAAARAVIEFQGRHGDRMRVDVAGGVDLVALARTFWRGGEP
jgi:hypothetical protein